MLLNSGVHKQCSVEAYFSSVAASAGLKSFKTHASGFQPVLNNQKSSWPLVEGSKQDHFAPSYLFSPLATVIDTAVDQTHLRLEPAGQFLWCLLNNPFFVLLESKLYLLVGDICKAAAATATEIKHLISKGILGLGKKKKKKAKERQASDSPPGYVERRTG